MFLVCLLALIATVRADGQARFDGHKLYKINVADPAGFRVLEEMREDDGFVFWGSSKISESADIMVPPEKFEDFVRVVNTSAFSIQLMMDDVQKYIDDENPRKELRAGMNWFAYHRLHVINEWLESLSKQHPDKVKLIIGGSSYEGRNITGVKVSFKEGNPGIFIEGGIHAREWISPAVVTYILNELLTSQESDVREMAESYDWYIFPSFNPDGYEYTHTRNRLWRKTRQPYGERCYGADPNRNWNFHWSEGGTSSDPCRETFHGKGPFSEPETRTMSEFINSIKDKIFAYIAFHSYSQLLLIPYGHTTERIENYDHLFQIGQASAKALAMRYGTKYKVGNVIDIIYVASGGSMDWVRGTHNIPIVYTYELRDTGSYGFLLPARQIIPTAEETLDSLVAMFQESRKLGYGIPEKEFTAAN